MKTPSLDNALFGLCFEVPGETPGHVAKKIRAAVEADTREAIADEVKAHEATKRDLDTALSALVELRGLCGRLAEALHPWKIHLESAASALSPLRVHGETRLRGRS